MSNSRKQIEAWLKTIEVAGSVIDIGGLFWPVKGRTKTWETTSYKILDIQKSRKGIQADYVEDINYYFDFTEPQFNVAFCIEVTDYLWNPVMAFENIARLLEKNGMLYVSSNFLFPNHTGLDCVRFTRAGLHRILKETGFKILHTEPRFATNVEHFGDVMRAESKVYYSPAEIGYMIKAQKI